MAVEVPAKEEEGWTISFVITTRSGVAFVLVVVAGKDVVSALVGTIFSTCGVGVQLLMILVTPTGSKMEAIEKREEIN